jgi:protein involved in polysaccharide export with SLBB domain
MRVRSLLRIGMSFLLLAGLSAVAQQSPADGSQNSAKNVADSSLSGSDQAPATPAGEQVAGNHGQQSAIPQLQTRDPRYRINKTDVLNVNFVFTPEYDQNLQVQPDGYVIPRGVPQLHAEGMTIPEFTEALQQAYGKILHDPVITVLPTNVVPAYFIAGGEVHNPGRYTFQGDTTVAQAISLAGGFTSYAKHSQVIVFRRINNEWVEGRRVDLKHMLNSANLSEDIHLEPGDMVYVPKNTISKIQQWLIPESDFVKFGFFGNIPLK